MYIWGRNNNHLFKQNHKKTYSLPQKIPIRHQIATCAPGHDYLLILTQQPGKLICYYQAAFYQINNFRNVVDVSTTDNMVVIVDSEGQAWIMEFNPDKIVSGELNPTNINVQGQVCRVFMNYCDIFLQTSQKEIYHMKRNQWYETKTYSDPTQLKGLENVEIISISPGFSHNYFLAQSGELFISDKIKPTQAYSAKVSTKFKAIAAADYLIGIGANGRLYIWGKYNEQVYDVPTEFGKLTQSFASVHLSAENGYAITQEGQGWVWGKNANGELGISDYEPRPKPYPLITLEKEKIKNIYIGQSYTVCTIESSKKVNMKKNNGMQLMFNYTEQSQTKKTPKASAKKIKKSPLNNTVAEYSSMKLRKTEKSISKIEANSKGINTEQVRISHKKNKTTERTPRKCCLKSNRSISPLSVNSRSKSPLSKSTKSPYLEHKSRNSFQNIKKKPNLNKTQLELSYKVNQYNEQKAKIASLQEQNQKLAQQSTAQIQFLTYKVHTLEEENNKLNHTIQIKQNVIIDITQKIQLLQDAIEEHERTLTSRDNMMQQYQRRQKEYQIHIDELEKNIQSLIKGKESLPQTQTYYNDMYNSLKLDFAKEKEHFMKKMTDYEQMFKAERSQYKNKIRQLEEQIHTHRTIQEKENQPRPFSIHNSRAQSRAKQSSDNAFSYKPLDESAQRMNFIISRIQDSKVRIAKSATKLYEMMDEK